MTKLKITKREARIEALQHAAALLQYMRFDSYDGDPLEEGDEDTGEAYEKLNQARLELAAQLAKRAGTSLKDLAWDGE